MPGSSKSYTILQEGDVTVSELKRDGTCRLKGWQWCVLILAFLLLLVVIAGLITGLIVIIIHNSSASNNSSITTVTIPTPSPSPAPSSCPQTPPSFTISCNATNERVCQQQGCCWYDNGTAQICIYELICSSNSKTQFTCLPEDDDWNVTVAERVCLSRGCCWNTTALIRCAYPLNYGYVIQGGLQDTPTGVEATLVRKNPFPSMYGGDIMSVKMEVTYETSYRLRVKIYDPAHPRYEVPLNLTSSVTQPPLHKPAKTLYMFDVMQSDTFGFQIHRTVPTHRTLFNATAPGFIMSDQFLQLSAYITSNYIYGLGEHATPWRLNMNYSKLTMFARDIPPDPVFDTTRNLYGVHPVYLCMEEGGNAHGVFFLNSNAMEVELLPYPAITYRTIGGILDFYYFLGPTPEDVVSQYTELIGRPFLPPYWSLGFHLCRWGYFSANRTLEIVERMREFGIPQDTQWNDIDYMSNHLDFTYNHTTYYQLPQVVQNLHDHGQHYVVITDPGISASQSVGSYPPFDDGVIKGVFILNSTNSPLLGTVWPGVTAYPDFTNPATEQYWFNQIINFQSNISFDGLWIDMNEPSNFIPGSINGCPNSTFNTPPYLPIAIRQTWGQDKLIQKTLCMTSKQFLSLHYNVHSLYGHTEAIYTMNALQSMFKKRSLVISRSTYPGSGTHCGHWLGDNASQWPHIRQSIPGILNFALFGIPLVGADICGFFDNTTMQLCTRWQQLGAFYPFSRNHNTYNTIPQDPTEFGNYSIASTRDILLTRYKLLPFLYTLFYFAHTNGTMVARPLLSVFPEDKETWTNARQFMWGKALLISPVLEENATSLVAYFPEGRWFDYRNGSELTTGNVSGHNITLDAPLNYIPLHILGGSIIPQQEPNTTTTLSRQNPFNLLIALNYTGQASGNLFLDDGEELNSIDSGHYTMLQFIAQKGNVTSTVLNNGYSKADDAVMNYITIYGLSSSPTNISVNGSITNSWKWTDVTKVLNVEVSITNLNKPFTMTWQ